MSDWEPWGSTIVRVNADGVRTSIPSFGEPSILTDPALDGARSIDCDASGFLGVAAYQVDSLVVVAAHDPTDMEVVGSITDVRLNGIRWVKAHAGLFVCAATLANAVTNVNPMTGLVEGSVTHADLAGVVRVTAWGPYLFACAGNKLVKIDNSDPTNPQRLGSVTHANLTTVFDVQVDANGIVLVVGSESSSVMSFDGRPDTPVFIDSLIDGTDTPAGDLSLPHNLLNLGGGVWLVTLSGGDGVCAFKVGLSGTLTHIASLTGESETLGGAHSIVSAGPHHVAIGAQTEDSLTLVNIEDLLDMFVEGDPVHTAGLDATRGLCEYGNTLFASAFGASGIVSVGIGGQQFGSAEIGSLWASRLFAIQAKLGDLDVRNGITGGEGGILSRGPGAFRRFLRRDGLDVIVEGDPRLTGGGGTATPDAFDAHVLGKAWSNTTFSTFTQLSTRWFCGSRKGSGGQNDEVVLKLDLPVKGGTYTLELFHTQTTDRGIYTITTSIDGSSYSALTTLDGYNATLVQTRSEVAGVTIPDGTQYVKIKMLTKNASSSGYNSEISGLYGLRTGA